jgi:3-hydroxyisobutyrate dehydrogenase
MNIAWIGLGHMGLPTAKKVAVAGHRVTAFDMKLPNPSDAESLVLASSARKAAKGCELLCIAVFSDAQVEELLIASGGLFPILEEGTVVAIFTTGQSPRCSGWRRPHRAASLCLTHVSVVSTRC